MVCRGATEPAATEPAATETAMEPAATEAATEAAATEPAAILGGGRGVWIRWLLRSSAGITVSHAKA